VKIVLFYLLPKNIISYLIGGLSKIKIPVAIRETLYGLYVKNYSVNLDESKLKLVDFDSFSKMFVRELKPNIRPISDTSEIVSPVDGTCANIGVVKSDTVFQAKGINYSLSSLFNDSIIGQHFADGAKYWTFYLAPGDYHRIHSPVEGRVVSRLYVPGHLFPVNEYTRNFLPNLFIENERVITLIETIKNEFIAVVKVAALNVGGIELDFEKDFRNRSLSNVNDRFKLFREPIPIKKGEELGSFYLGSTVIVVSNIKGLKSLDILNSKVKYGEKIVEND